MKHDFSIEGVIYKIHDQLRILVPGSKAQFLAPKLFLQEVGRVWEVNEAVEFLNSGTGSRWISNG